MGAWVDTWEPPIGAESVEHPPSEAAIQKVASKRDMAAPSSEVPGTPRRPRWAPISPTADVARTVSVRSQATMPLSIVQASEPGFPIVCATLRRVSRRSVADVDPNAEHRERVSLALRQQGDGKMLVLA